VFLRETFLGGPLDRARPCELAAIRYKLTVSMKLTDWALVAPLLTRAFFSTFRSGRKYSRANQIEDLGFRKDVQKLIARNWAEKILKELKVKAEHSGIEPINEPCIFVGNHMSYLDIMVLSSLHPVQFVAKAELQKWPVVGKAAAAGGTIFVKRDSRGSKLETAQAIRDGILRDRKQIAVFPEGTTSLTGGPWKRGIFRIAHELQVPVQVFSICYEPARRAAYIGKDHFFTHMVKLIGSGGVKARLEFTHPRLIKDLDQDVKELETWCRGRLWEQLTEQGIDPTAPVST
jgi:1-acyl-sn-glycerol-3-phosphate acyltransferase